MALRIGIITTGGDCPGLNAVIRALVRKSVPSEALILGVKNGWRGLIDGDLAPLTRASVTGILPRGGTILGTSRINPTVDLTLVDSIRFNWARFNLNALVVVGGEGSLRAARDMWREHGFPIVAVPKTIDNDLGGTDFTFGFDTAVSVVTEAIDRLHSTAESHHRVMVIEVMGRHTGWIAAYGGIAGGADAVLVPEHPFRLSHVSALINRRKEQGRSFSIVVVAEDARPHAEEDFLTDDARREIYQHDHLGGIGNLLALEIEGSTGLTCRVTKLGYVQRGGSPTAFDRVLATRFGVKAYEMVLGQEWGCMAALKGNRVVSVPLDEAVREVKKLDDEIFRVAEVFFG